MNIDLNPEIVCFLIGKAHEFHNLMRQIGEEEPVVDLSGAAEASVMPIGSDDENKAYAEMVNTVNDLEPDQQICLVALMWLGRGDFLLEEWDTALEEATRALTTVRRTI